MIKSERYQALNLWNEYLGAYTKQSENVSSITGINQQAFISSEYAAHITSDGNAERMLVLTTDRVRIGDSIDVEVEFAKVGEGSSGTVLIEDENYPTIFTEYPSTNLDEQFKCIKIKHTVNANTRYKVKFGLKSGQHGSIKIRKIRILVSSSMQTEQTRKIVIEGNETLPQKFKTRADFYNDEATVTSGINFVSVVWKRPFTTELKPVISIMLDSAGSGALYNVRISTVSKTSLYVHFYTFEGVLINIADLNLTSSMLIHIIATS